MHIIYNIIRKNEYIIKATQLNYEGKQIKEFSYKTTGMKYTKLHIIE